MAVPTRGACEPSVPSGADQTVPLTTLSLQGKPWWWGLCGSVVLVVYGFIPCMQPMSDFGRVYAVYGGFFIALSYLWGEHPRRPNPNPKLTLTIRLTRHRRTHRRRVRTGRIQARHG